MPPISVRSCQLEQVCLKSFFSLRTDEWASLHATAPHLTNPIRSCWLLALMAILVFLTAMSSNQIQPRVGLGRNFLPDEIKKHSRLEGLHQTGSLIANKEGHKIRTMHFLQMFILLSSLRLVENGAEGEEGEHIGGMLTLRQRSLLT